MANCMVVRPILGPFVEAPATKNVEAERQVPRSMLCISRAVTRRNAIRVLRTAVAALGGRDRSGGASRSLWLAPMVWLARDGGAGHPSPEYRACGQRCSLRRSRAAVGSSASRPTQPRGPAPRDDSSPQRSAVGFCQGEWYEVRTGSVPRERTVLTTCVFRINSRTSALAQGGPRFLRLPDSHRQ